MTEKQTGGYIDMLTHDTLHIYLALYQLPDHIRNVIPEKLVFYLEDLLENGQISFPQISAYGRTMASAIAYTYFKASGHRVKLADFFPELTRKQQEMISHLRRELLETFEYAPSAAGILLPQWPHYRMCVFLDRRMQGISVASPLPVSSGHYDYCLAIANRTHQLLSAPISFGDYLLDSEGKITGIQCATSVIDRTYGVLEGPIEMNQLTFSKAFTFEKKERTDSYQLWLFRRYELLSLEDVLRTKYSK
ncbi:MAG: hypothetical protein II126_05515 [Erysipelotrichaceae bacterium]|nr:hypothetical protein [Erysipelotrichaceae bacterium]